MVDPPSSLPSPGYLAETNRPQLDQQISIAFIVINTFFITVLFISRYYNPKAVVIPMLVCNTVCYFLCLGTAIAGILMTQIGGVGHHTISLPIQTLHKWLKLAKVVEFTYTPAVMFSKLALLFLYYHVFEVPIYRKIIIGIGVVVVLQGLTSFILMMMMCKPFGCFCTDATSIPSGSCKNTILAYKLYGVPSLVTDVAMMVLPWPILAKLRIPRTERVGLILTFLTASLGIIVCTLRFVSSFTIPLFSDPTWYGSGGPMIYALVEPSIYMICNILPATRHLYRRLRQKARYTAELRSAKSSSGTRTDAAQSLNNDHNESSGITIDIATQEVQSQQNRHSSQVGLTFGVFLDELPDTVWNRMSDVEDQAGYFADTESKSKPREMVKKRIDMREHA